MGETKYEFNVDAVASTEWNEACKAGDTGRRRTSAIEAFLPLFGTIFHTSVMLWISKDLIQSMSFMGQIGLISMTVLGVAAVQMRPHMSPWDYSTSKYALAWPVKKEGSPPPEGSVSDETIDDDSPPGESWPRRNARIRQLKSTSHKNLDDMFTSVVKQKNSHPCTGSRKLHGARIEESKGKKWTKLNLGDYEWQSYGKVDERKSNISHGLRELGVKRSERFGIYGSTSADWMNIALAGFHGFNPVVTVYATLGKDALAYALDQAAVSTLFVDQTLLKNVVEIMNGKTIESSEGEVVVNLAHLKRIVLISDYPSNTKESQDEVAKAKEHLQSRSDTAGGPIDVFELSEVESRGATAPAREEEYPALDDEAVVMYTSGSTGLPKAAVLTHKNLLAAISGLSAGVPELDTTDVYIGYLPSAHVLELVAELCILRLGGSIGYSHPFTLVDTAPMIDRDAGSRGDANILRPTLMAAVPAVMERLQNTVNSKVESAGALTQKLFKLAYYYKSKAVENGQTSPFWDWLIFDKIRTQALGGRVRIMLSGGGPLAGDIQRFMNVVFCCPVGQGYGLTETAGAGTIVWPNERKLGRVGPPVLCCDIKLVDWEEGGYTSKDKPNPRGEVCISGDNLCQGYLGMPEKTKEDFRKHKDGRTWFHTGDIGEWDHDGVLRIIDRKKDLVKLSRGEYIALGSVESQLKKASWVENLCLYANSEHAYVVAVVVPNMELVEKHYGTSKPEDVSTNKELIDTVMKSVKNQAKQAGLSGYETPRKILLAKEQWTPANELLTAAMKLKRPAVNKKYKDELEKLYQED